MPLWLAWVEWAIAPVQVLVIVGLVARRRLRRVWLWPAYLLASSVVRVLQLGWGGAFRTWQAWVSMELPLKLMAVGVVVEITVRVFARLPGAAPWARRALALVALATAASLWTAPGVGDGDASSSWLYVMVVEILPRLAFGAAALCVATLVVMAAYGVPLDDLHGAVLFGLALYLLLYAGPLGSADTHEPARFVVYYVTPVAYLGILVLWAYAAWRREREPGVSPEVVRRLQPWK